MADTGFLFPGTAVGNRTISGGTINWGTPDNIKADDAANASTGLNTLETSRGLEATNFDFSGASGTIDGIETRVGDYSEILGQSGWAVMRLILADDTDGSENNQASLATPTSSLQTSGHGGASELWGETIGVSDVQDVDWGFFLGTSAAGGGFNLLNLDFMQMKVFYTEGGAAGINPDLLVPRRMLALSF